MPAQTGGPGIRLLPVVLRCLPALAWAGWIFYLSSQPEPLGQRPGVAASLAAHAAVYAVLAALTLLAAGGPARAGWRAYAAVLAAVSLYGLSDEVHQAFVPGRSPSVLDWAADTAGAAAALALLRLWTHRRPPAAPRLPSRRGTGGGDHNIAE